MRLSSCQVKELQKWFLYTKLISVKTKDHKQTKEKIAQNLEHSNHSHFTAQFDISRVSLRSKMSSWQLDKRVCNRYGGQARCSRLSFHSGAGYDSTAPDWEQSCAEGVFEDKMRYFVSLFGTDFMVEGTLGEPQCF